MKATVLMIALLVSGAAAASDVLPSAIAVDYASGEVLYCQRCERSMPPSSMSKLMTIELVFQRLKDGRLWSNDHFQVSHAAWRGAHRDDEAKMGLEVGSRVSIDDLLKGIIVQSGGDAGLVLAEAIAGSEQGFAALMNDRAAELGLEDSHFSNARGLTEAGQYMSAHDIARLAAHILRTYPEYYRYFGLARFAWNGKRFYNRNPLLGMDGVDGLKTGHTAAGGYGLAASALRGGRRVIVVVNGLPSDSARGREARRLLELGFDKLRDGPTAAENVGN